MLKYLPKLPRWLPFVIGFLSIGTLVPFAVIARARNTTSDKPRIHPIQDMDNQTRYKAQQENILFADGRSMRPPVPGTVARGELRADSAYYLGRDADGKWVTEYPRMAADAESGAKARFDLDRAFFERGRERYQIYCSMCHGLSGYGDGPVHQRVQLLQGQGVPGNSTWAAPASYHAAAIRGQSVGELFNTISNGKKNMAGYKGQIPTRDRWAIVFYVKALQRSQNPE